MSILWAHLYGLLHTHTGNGYSDWDLENRQKHRFRLSGRTKLRRRLPFPNISGTEFRNRLFSSLHKRQMYATTGAWFEQPKMSDRETSVSSWQRQPDILPSFLYHFHSFYLYVQQVRNYTPWHRVSPYLLPLNSRRFHALLPSFLPSFRPSLYSSLHISIVESPRIYLWDVYWSLRVRNRRSKVTMVHNYYNVKTSLTRLLNEVSSKSFARILKCQ